MAELLAHHWWFWLSTSADITSMTSADFITKRLAARKIKMNFSFSL
jgi:hypothetical protein